jgi:hypothetical protein
MQGMRHNSVACRPWLLRVLGGAWGHPTQAVPRISGADVPSDGEAAALPDLVMLNPIAPRRQIFDLISRR